jgi:hypothetical protein
LHDITHYFHLNTQVAVPGAVTFLQIFLHTSPFRMFLMFEMTLSEEEEETDPPVM